MNAIKDDTPERPKTDGFITIQRTRDSFGRARRIGIFVNDRKVGCVRSGETKTFTIAEGRQKIFAKIDWAETAPIIIDLAPDENVVLYLGSDIVKGWKFFAAPAYMFQNPTEQIYLRRPMDTTPPANYGSAFYIFSTLLVLCGMMTIENSLFVAVAAVSPEAFLSGRNAPVFLKRDPEYLTYFFIFCTFVTFCLGLICSSIAKRVKNKSY